MQHAIEYGSSDNQIEDHPRTVVVDRKLIAWTAPFTSLSWRVSPNAKRGAYQSAEGLVPFLYQRSGAFMVYIYGDDLASLPGRVIQAEARVFRRFWSDGSTDVFVNLTENESPVGAKLFVVDHKKVYEDRAQSRKWQHWAQKTERDAYQKEDVSKPARSVSSLMVLAPHADASLGEYETKAEAEAAKRAAREADKLAEEHAAVVYAAMDEAEEATEVEPKGEAFAQILNKALDDVIKCRYAPRIATMILDEGWEVESDDSPVVTLSKINKKGKKQTMVMRNYKK